MKYLSRNLLTELMITHAQKMELAQTTLSQFLDSKICWHITQKVMNALGDIDPCMEEALVSLQALKTLNTLEHCPCCRCRAQPRAN